MLALSAECRRRCQGKELIASLADLSGCVERGPFAFPLLPLPRDRSKSRLWVWACWEDALPLCCPHRTGEDAGAGRGLWREAPLLQHSGLQLGGVAGTPTCAVSLEIVLRKSGAFDELVTCGLFYLTIPESKAGTAALPCWLPHLPSCSPAR